MELSTLYNKLCNDIDKAYDEAIDLRTKQIRNCINEIIYEFQRNKLSMYGLLNLDSINDFESINTSILLPKKVKIGYINPIGYQLPQDIKIPLIIDLSKSKGISFALNKVNTIPFHNIIQNIVLRIILSLPENMCDITIYDPVSNGSNFSHLLALDKVKNNLITDETQLYSKLNEIVSDFTKIQTNLLSYKYNNIEEYNLAVNLNQSDVTIPYNIILFSNFPEGFGYRRENMINLKKIIENGYKYGTIVLMTSDEQLINSQTFQNSQDLVSKISQITQTDKNNFKITNCDESFIYTHNYNFYPDLELPLNKHKIINHLKQRSLDANKQSNSFEYFYNEQKDKNKFWSFSSKDFIEFNIGFVGANKISGFHLGQKDGKSNFHALIGGRTGSGKSNFIHNIIINSAYMYSPEELQFYLIDMKGTSFSDYYLLPHVKVLFQDGEKVDIALNVLHEVQKEYFRRVKEFKNLKIDEFSNFRNNKKLHRILLIIDEFQTFNQSDNYEAKNKSKEIIEQLITKGRAYGIHVILASQHLANANLSETAKDNIQVRLVLPLNPDACHYILSRENTEPQNLNIGQLIYNDVLGYSKSNNINFRIPELNQGKRKIHVGFLLDSFKSSGIKDFTRYFLPGEENVMLESNTNFYNIGKTEITNNKIYIGKPYFIREEDSYISFEKRIENNLLILGQDLSVSYKVIFLVIYQFLSQNPKNKVYYLQYTPKSSKYYNIFNNLNGYYSDNFFHKDFNDVNSIFDELEEDILKRKNNVNIDSNILLIIPQINSDTTFNARGNITINRLKSIFESGPTCGVHSIIHIESYNSFYETQTFSNLSSFKIAVKGGDSSKIVEKKEVEDSGMIYLSAPSEYTSINPDLITVYNSYEKQFLDKIDEKLSNVIKNLFDMI